jgi:hypothetical protein
LKEFSSSFSIITDSINYSGAESLYLRIKLNFSFESNITTARLVVSATSQGKDYFWEGRNFSFQILDLNPWKSNNFEIIIGTKDIIPGSILKVYVWNPDKNKGFIDNFEIEILGV